MATRKEQAPHEGMFLKIFKNLENTRHFLKMHMSEELQKRFDLKTLSVRDQADKAGWELIYLVLAK